MYKQLIRPILFKFDPENIHHFVFSAIKTGHRIPGVGPLVRSLFTHKDSSLERELFGLKFRNPIGLAAGFDKNAELYNELADYGFGFIEIGTVTPDAQEGNPKKRMFRLSEDRGLINRMGFNNKGLDAVITKLKGNKNKLIIGGNLGKNTASMPDEYIRDYVNLAEGLHPYVNYFVLNVSCPNVGSMAKLQDKDFLMELIAAVEEVNSSKGLRRPLLLKIAPDLNQIQLDEIIDIVRDTAVDGVIASNTSTDRSGLRTSPSRIERIGNGGLSGQPIKDKSTAVIKYLAEKSNKAFPIIGVGGIQTAQDAKDKLEAGADLLQVYTGFIYEGPSIVKNILKGL
ncbi:quinone-dependent dihydroorotate dehydrogenase [Flavobacteriaceae bacterium]|nr:quinone-dependent dihydroorotate dehydrogenase [Flavobacteriaceae bacterium]